MPASPGTQPPRDTPWRGSGRALIVRFRLTPRASRQEIGGTAPTADGPAFLARVRAVPEDGAANRALLALVADWLQVPAKRVALNSGAKSRIKTVAVDGEVDRIDRLLEERWRALGGGA